jgi:hypothetical protein
LFQGVVNDDISDSQRMAQRNYCTTSLARQSLLRAGVSGFGK